MKNIRLVEEANEVLRIEFLSKNVDELNAWEIREELNQQTFSEKQKLILDLGKVKYISSAGLSILVSIKKRVHLGTIIEIANADDGVKNILRVVSFDKLFNMV